ncbi:MAG: hypothetical protein ABIR78_08100 [Ferruginibacter sp.]
MKKILLTFCTVVVFLKASPQSAAINDDGSASNNSAMLEIKSNSMS